MYKILRYEQKLENIMDSVKTTRLIKKQDSEYEIEIPEEFIKKLDWRKGYVLSIDVQGSKLVIEKLHGFMGI